MDAAPTSRQHAALFADTADTLLDAPAPAAVSAEIPVVPARASLADAYAALHAWRTQAWAVFSLHLPAADADAFLYELRILCERAARLEAYVRARRMPGVSAVQHADQMDGRVDRVPLTRFGSHAEAVAAQNVAGNKVRRAIGLKPFDFQF